MSWFHNVGLHHPTTPRIHGVPKVVTVTIFLSGELSSQQLPLSVSITVQPVSQVNSRNGQEMAWLFTIWTFSRSLPTDTHFLCAPEAGMPGGGSCRDQERHCALRPGTAENGATPF